MSPETALAALLGRIDVIESTVGDRFPLYADPESGAWTTTARGSWTGGFWVGLLWLRARLSGRSVHHETAAGWTSRLLPRARDDTDTRAMTFWYGAGVGHQLTGDRRAGLVALTGATAVCESFDQRRRLVPVGTALHGPGEAPLASPDAFAAIVALMNYADGTVPGAVDVAAHHAQTLIGLCVGAEGAVRTPTAAARSHPPGRDGGWTRGQAWAMLGCAVAADRLGERYREPALRTANWWLRYVPTEDVPPAQLGAGPSPPDTSAATIALAALMTLGAASYVDTRDAGRFRTAAGTLLARLVEENLDQHGVLRNGCYDVHRGVAPAHELIWGTYFLTAALAVHCGHVDFAAW